MRNSEMSIDHIRSIHLSPSRDSASDGKNGQNRTVVQTIIGLEIHWILGGVY